MSGSGAKFLLLLGLALGLSLPAFAAFPDAGKIKTAFAALDTSRNGAISEMEWEQGSAALFRAADRNQNGFIDGDEITASGIAEDTFLRADRDHDGRLSEQEFSELRRRLFQAADIDRDGSLIYVEYEIFIILEHVGWVDRNNSERVELSELRESLTRLFELLDTNHDGKLSPAEATYLRSEAFKAYDRDEDNFLTLDELFAGYRTDLGA